MKKCILFLLSVLMLGCASTAMAQEYDAPNYARIKKQINNSKMSTYYPRLMERYEACDTLLTNEEYRLLYYGFALSEDFVPYLEKPKEFYDMRRMVYKKKATKAQLQEVVKMTQEILENNPFDLAAITLSCVCNLQLGDSTTFALQHAKVDALIEAITSSGDGETPRSAYHVTDVEHEYEITSRQGLTVVKDSTVNENVEYLRVEFPNAEDIEGIYFNFGACGNIYKQKYE